MIARFHEVDPNEPAVTNAQLAELVDHARRRPPPEIRVTAEQLQAGWRKRHHRRILGITAGLMTAAAASWLVMVIPQALTGRSDSGNASLAADQRSEDSLGGKVVPRQPTRAVVRPTEPEQHHPQVAEADGAGTLEELDGEEKSTKPSIESEREDSDEADARPVRRRLGPSALARRADRYLAAGDRERAIQTWETLVTRYPKASTARGALLDLGRAYRATGQRARARCAYQLFMERWPYSQLRTEVERALDDLGEGRCRGLEPR